MKFDYFKARVPAKLDEIDRYPGEPADIAHAHRGNMEKAWLLGGHLRGLSK
jgi:hypothetical protein